MDMCQFYNLEMWDPLSNISASVIVLCGWSDHYLYNKLILVMALLCSVELQDC